MRTLITTILTCALLIAESASSPKAPGTGLLESVPTIQPLASSDSGSTVRALPSPDSGIIAGHQVTPDGTPILLLRYKLPGASSVRLRFSSLRLPEGASLFVYALNQDGYAVNVSSPLKIAIRNGAEDFWSDAVPGEQAIVEVVWGQEVPGFIPFEIPEIMSAETGAEPLAADATHSGVEVRTSYYRGTELTYEVRGEEAVFENDIILGRAEQVAADHAIEQADGKNIARFGAGIKGARYRWPKGRIPYTISASIPDSGRIHSAISHWNSTLRGVIQLVPRTTEEDYVAFQRSYECSSYIGMIGGAQSLRVSDVCTTGSLIHEIGHAVGLWHEQSRSDRNSHVRILWLNILGAALSNFSSGSSVASDYGTYDYNSIMHYNAYAFSLNYQPTLETIPAGIPIGQRNGLSAGDINTVQRMYGATVTQSPAPAPAPAPTPAPTPTPAPAPVTTTLNVSSNPTGQQIRVDGITYVAPRSFTWTVGSSHTVEAVSEAQGSQGVSNWVSWSNGGGRVQTIIASRDLTSLLATYSTKFQVRVSANPSSAGTVTLSPRSSDDLYAYGSMLSLKAEPDAGYCFSSWTGLLGGTPAATSFSVSSSRDLQANFVRGAFTLSPGSAYISGAGGTFKISVSASGQCPWSASATSSWVDIAAGRSGTGSGVVTYSVDRNTSGPRIAFLTVAGNSFLILQGSE